MLSGKLLVVGDFNLHLDIPTKPEVAKFLDSLKDAGLTQHIDEPTHGDHILDLVISRPDDSLVLDCKVLDILYSKHHVIKCSINRAKQCRQKVTSSTCNYKDMDRAAYKANLCEALQYFPFESDIEVDFYDQAIRDVLDKHCPINTRTHVFKCNPQWYTKDILLARRNHRNLE